jgi:hypothetical protein
MLGLERWLEAGLQSVRAAAALRDYLKTPPPTQCLELITQQVQGREESFLNTLRRAIFDRPVNPFAEMLFAARCRYEDIENSVRRQGLENTLRELHSAGVYLTQDEFKGRTPIVRAGREIRSTPTSFQNPLAKGSMRHLSSGSRGKAVATMRSREFTLHQEAMHELVVREFQLDRHFQIILRPTLPSALGVQDCAIAVRKGHRVAAWYAPGRSGPYAPATKVLTGLARAYGCRIPSPRIVPDNDFSPAAELIARLRGEGHACLVSGPVSTATRVAAAALDRSWDIRGTLFLVSGESLTKGKSSVMLRAGGEPYARYGVSELGFVGHACRHMKGSGSVHLYSNAIAAITHRRRGRMAEAEVDSLFFTTLLSTAPHVLINFETEDNGVLEEARCDCEFSRAGMRWRIHDLSSFGKMTGHGVTILGTDLVRLLEQTMPSRLGGHPGDFQLVERDGESQTALELRVSPRVRESSREKIRACFLEELRLIYGGALANRIWQHADALNVVLAEPLVTGSGKVLSLHLLGTTTANV